MATDIRDKRDPEKLYERIQKIMKSNPDWSITRAANIADAEYHSMKNGKLHVR